MVRIISFLVLSVAILVTGVIAFRKLNYWERSARIFIYSSAPPFEGRMGRGPGRSEGRGEFVRQQSRPRDGERMERAPFEGRMRNNEGRGRGEFPGGKKINIRNVKWFLAVFASFTVIVIYIDKAICLIHRRKGRKNAIKGIKIPLTFTAVSVLALGSATGQTKDPLLFPKDNFTVEIKTVKATAGEKKVTYRSYMHIPYVANPVDKDYESMNVSVPIKIDEVTIDATNAPILFTIGVGGYMSSSNMRSSLRGGPNGNSKVSGNADLALAAGYVVVSPGCRGRDNKATDGTYFGKAPAAIVDLKAAVRYIRHNQGVMPGNVNWIFSTGVSAGGALSALLGSSGNSPLYDSYLKEIGAARAADNIFGSACFCPITDLEHADGAYEWMYGTKPARSGLVDQELSIQLKALYARYQASLSLQGKNGFGTITADNYDKYLLQYYLIPSANKYLRGLPDEKRIEYLVNNKWITWTDKGASFAFADYVTHVGRMKGLPAFDDFDMRQPEPNLFGNKTTDARHFTSFSLRQASGDKSVEIDSEVKTLVNMMNAMYFIDQNNSGCAKYWWLRQGTSDNHTSQTVIANLSTSLENRNKVVNTFLYWDAGHGADQDAEDFITWIDNVTGFSRNAKTGK